MPKRHTHTHTYTPAQRKGDVEHLGGYFTLHAHCVHMQHKNPYCIPMKTLTSSEHDMHHNTI